MATNCPQDRLLYQGQVRSQLEQMGDLGPLVNPYGSPPGDDTEKPKPSKPNSEVPLWPPGILGFLFRKQSEAPQPR